MTHNGINFNCQLLFEKICTNSELKVIFVSYTNPLLVGLLINVQFTSQVPRLSKSFNFQQSSASKDIKIEIQWHCIVVVNA